MLVRAIFLLAATGSAAPVTGPDLPGLSWVTIVWIAGLLGFVGLAILVLHLVQLVRSVFGRKPALDVTLGAKADRGDLDRLEVDIKGFVRTQDMDVMREEHRLRWVGLQAEISESRHAWREEFNAWQLAAKDRDEERSGRLSRLEERMVAAGQSLAAVAKQADLILASLHNLDAKVDRNNERRIPAGHS